MSNNIKRFAVAVLAACGLAVSAALAAPSYQAKLTVQGYAEDKEPLENFPVLVRLSPQTVAGFHYGICKADGSDIVFVDENGDPLNYQLDTWNPSGESLFWVKLPQLAKNKSFYVRWGDSQSNVDSARSAATWNANYGAVWHMGEASGVCANSTSHGSAYDATPMGETTESVRYEGPDAPVGGARTTSKGKNAYLVVPDYNALQCGDTFTFSGWMHLTGGRWGNPLSRKTSPNEKSGWEMMQSGTSFSKFVALGQGGSGVTGEFNPGVDKAWAHFALVYSGSTVSVYGNGALLKSGAITAVNDNDKPLYIGNTGLADNHFVTGAFDELRLMKGAASADWVQAEYDTVAKADFLAYGASGPAWTAQKLDISGVAVVARGDSFVDLSAMLHGLGENATEATIQLAYGLDETSLVKTQGVWTAKETGPMTLRLDRLLPQRVYCVQAVAVNDQGEQAVSAPIHVMTAVSQDASGVGDLQAIQVDEVVADGKLQKLTLTFPPAEEARDLYVAWGGQHGGATMNGWNHIQKLTTVESRCGTYEYTLPEDWGTDDNRVIRFFLDGTPRSCSSSVYWRDCSEPLITELSLDGRGGDTLQVTGSLASFAGSSCTLKVLVGQTPEALDQVWTELEGSGLQEPGAFALTLCSEDKTSSKYLAPGETYYVCVEATAGDSVSRSQVMQVTMAKAAAIGSATHAVTRRTVKFSGDLEERGMGESAKVSLWVGETDDAEKFVQAGEEQDKQGGKFSFEHTFPKFEQTYYWQFRAVSTSAGDTAVVTTRTDVATCHTLDTTTYTWTGAADSDWRKRENWSDNQNGDSYGYPQSSAATVIFSAGTKAQIVLRGEMSVGTLNLEAAGIEVTFTHAAGQEAEEAKPKLTLNQLKISGASLRLALDGVELYCSSDVKLSDRDGEVRLTNGAAWDLSSKTLNNDNGGRLLLGPGTSLTCSVYKFGGGLTVIDDATLKVRSSAVLGTNMDGGTIRFVGTQPAFLCSTQDVKVYSNRETANVRLEFALPVGGYETPPFRNASANPKYILGYYDGSQKKPHPITVDVARDSPAALDRQKMTTTLISWGKGICPEIIQTTAKPGANAEFVWSEKTVGNNAYPVSLDVRLVPTGFIIRVR